MSGATASSSPAQGSGSAAAGRDAQAGGAGGADAGGAGGADAGPAPLTGAALTIAAVALAAGAFMQVLDTTIANVSLDTIAGNLGESSDDATWVITAFAAANGVTVPLTGWLMRRFGVVRVFIGSVMAFTVASLLCGLAWSLPVLVVFRMLQGAVSGPMIPGSQALLIAIFPPEKRTVALTVWSVTVLVGPVLGPILGGYICDNYFWNLIFLINVPVGIVTTFVLISSLTRFNTAAMKVPLDKMGVFLLIVWIASLQVLLDLGKDDDWFNSTKIVILAIVAGVGFVAWVIWELTEKMPAVDLTLFANRNFAIGMMCFCGGYAVFFANMLLLPLWLQQNVGYTATWAGLVTAPSGAVAIFLSPLVSRISGKIDIRWLGSFSFLTFGISFLMRARFAADTDFWHFVVPILVQGVSMSMFFTSMIAIQLDGIPPHRVPAATGLSNFGRITMGGFASSITTYWWSRRQALHQSRLVEALNPGHPAYTQVMHQFAAMGISTKQAIGTIAAMTSNQAYLLASTDLFWLSGVLALVMIAPIWLARRPKPPSGPVAAD